MKLNLTYKQCLASITIQLLLVGTILFNVKFTNMNKGELVAYVANKTGMTKKDVTSVLDAIVDAVVKSVKGGEAVTLTNFGTFVAVQRKASTKRNPKTGAPVKVAAKRVPRFRAGKNFREVVAK